MLSGRYQRAVAAEDAVVDVDGTDDDTGGESIITKSFSSINFFLNVEALLAAPRVVDIYNSNI